MKDKEILEYLNHYLNDMFDILDSQTFKCSMYLLRYIYDDDICAYKEYEKIYQGLNNEEKKQICINVAGNLIEH
ncbi:MAG: hypothetical protein IKN63_04720 [Bacilli bacterium]|nr:hypothetical protein [Bacilli bacterium]